MIMYIYCTLFISLLLFFSIESIRLVYVTHKYECAFSETTTIKMSNFAKVTIHHAVPAWADKNTNFSSASIPFVR